MFFMPVTQAWVTHGARGGGCPHPIQVPGNVQLAGSRILQTCEHVGWRQQLAFWVTIALLFCAYSHCGPFLYEYIQTPTDLAEQMLSGNSTTSYSNLVFKLFAIPICNR